MNDMTPWIETQSGRAIPLGYDLSPDHIDIEDIARALSKLCRYTGHTRYFYSVARHSILCAKYVEGPPEVQLEALLHDAMEAYLGDVSSPLKGLLPEYRKIEDYFEQVIREKFKLPDRMSPAVKRIDLEALYWERQKLMPKGPDWPCLNGITPDWTPDFMDLHSIPEHDEIEFLVVYERLSDEIGA